MNMPNNIVLLIVVFLDNINKIFQYAWFLVIPFLLLIIILIIIKRQMKKKGIKKTNIISIVILLIIFCLLVATIFVRFWGPYFYKGVIGYYICGKNEIIEKKLERKYNKNFTFIDNSKIIMENYSESTINQNVENDYNVIYKYKDDDGVVAIVEYKKNVQFDWYKAKRSKYDIEKYIYDYAKKVNFNKKFYVTIDLYKDLIDYTELDEKPMDNYIYKERSYDRILFILTEKSESNKEFIINALKPLYGERSHVYVHEFNLTEDEYVKALDFYNELDLKINNEVIDNADSFSFNENNKIFFDSYYINE